jgi:hypothetical protein
VHDTLRIVSDGVDSTVDGKAGGIDIVRRIHHDLSIKINLHEAGGCNLLKKHPEGIDEEMILATWNSR